MYTLRLVRISLLCTLVAFGITAQSQDCGQILEHGIFNTSATDSLKIRTQTLVNWLSQSTFQSFGQSRDAGLKLGFDIGGLPTTIGGHSRDSQWSQYQASLQTLDFSDEKNLDAFKQIVSAADAGIVNAWQTCILNSRGIAHSVVELNYDPTKFTVRLLYDPVGPPETAKIVDFVITPDTVHCAPTISSHWYWHEEITSSGWILNCTRKSATDAIQVTGNTAKGPLSAKLPGIVPRATEVATVVAKAEEPAKEQSARCDKNTLVAVYDQLKIGDQDLYHVRCPAGGIVNYARYDSCQYAGGEPCRSINARNEMSGACPDDPKSACIYYQTNDGNFKTIHGVYVFIPDRH